MNGSDGDGEVEHPDEPDDNVRAEAARKGSPFLNTQQAAHYLGISFRTLEDMRDRGEGPPFRKHGRQFRYHIVDVDAWSLANRWDSTMGRPRAPSDGNHES